MTIQRGTRLGPYEITQLIGAGGMGEVYRAIDTRLDRAVAVKVLPTALAENPQRRARFEREARTISALNHPNICRLFDIGRDDDTEYLVMELLEGETLADRLLKGPMPLSQVLKTGAEIASALDGAHRQHVVHRDLKPSNVMLTRSGARLLDFGLAKECPFDHDPAGASTQSQISTEGSLVGTLGYMAPEQLGGKPPDTRTDLWALGTILYEMATGRPAFDEPSSADMIAAIMTREPVLRQISNAGLQHVIRKCLAKDPNDRWQSAHDVAEELRWVSETASSEAGPVSGVPERSRHRLAAAVTLAAVAIAAIASWGWWRAASRRTSAAARLSIPFPPGTEFTDFGCPNVAISPDGERVAFSVRRNGKFELYSRRLDDFTISLVTDKGGCAPVFSPDGVWIGYMREGRLLKVRATGGPEHFITDVPTLPRGASWAPDGTIFFAWGISGGIWKVSADGKHKKQLTIPDEAAGENSHRWPHLLPDGRHVLFTIRTDRLSWFDDARVAVLSLETGQWKTVIEGGSNPKYLPTGHLLFADGGSLMAVPFHLETLTVRGAPAAVVRGVMFNPITGAAQYAVADRVGTFLYAPGERRQELSEVVKVNRQGAVIGSFTVAKFIQHLRVSTDLKRIAIQAAAANDDLWIYEIPRETLTRLTFESGDETAPNWTPDGKSVVFGGRNGGYLQAADGTSSPERLVDGAIIGAPSVSPDGRTLAYTQRATDTGLDVWLVNLHGERRRRPLAATRFNELSPEFSPDGRWIAHLSNESGLLELYLRSVAGAGRLQVSSGGGESSRWSRDGRELYYKNGDEFFRVSVSPGKTATLGKPHLMFRGSDVSAWDVFGDEFLMIKNPYESSRASGIHVVPDWFREVKTLSR